MMTAAWTLREVVANKTGIPLVDKGLEWGWKTGFSVLDQTVSQMKKSNPWVDSILAKIDPVLSTKAIKATVTRIVQETGDTKTYFMKPNARWQTSFKPGSYIHLKFPVEGKVTTRTYSLSSSPFHRDGFSITVKKVPGGKVSNWLFDRLRVGQTLEISEPMGDFVLPEVPPTRLLMISGGSGITPVMSMLRYLTDARMPADVVFLHCAKTPADIIFHKELRSLAGRFPNVCLKLAVDEAQGDWNGLQGQMSQTLLEQAAPDFKDRDIYLCGPGGFMTAVTTILETTGYDLTRLHLEHFTPVTAKTVPGVPSDSELLIRFERSGIRASGNGETLLETAEAAGLEPAYGCRMGICTTCRCRKVKGTVMDVHTGRLSSDGEEYILPCVSIPQGEVQLDL